MAMKTKNKTKQTNKTETQNLYLCGRELTDMCVGGQSCMDMGTLIYRQPNKIMAYLTFSQGTGFGL